MKITCETKDKLELSELTDFQGELKHRTKEDVQKIITSIEKFGFATPFFVWSHDGINHVLDGHGRLLALRKMKSAGEDIPPLPIVHVDCADEEHAKKLLLRITSQYGEMTSESVLEFMEGLELEVDEIALPEGVLNIDFPHDEEDTSADDEVPEVQDEAISQLGEMYELGDSILMCGDSTSEEDVARLMNGQKADMVFTDPPYGVDYKGINNDDRSGLEELLRKAFQNMMDNSKKGASFYCFHSDKCADIFHKVYREFCHFSSMIIWKKKSLVLSRTDYQSIHEPCLYGWFNNGDHLFFGDRKQTSVWEFGRENIEGHTTPKPTDLICHALELSSKTDDVIIDLFGGSGSTLIACEKSGRKCFTMELDPHYCDVIRRRYTKWAKENNKPLTSGCLE